MEKITHDPKLSNGLHQKEETVEALRRQPSLERKAVIKVSHDPICPNGV